MKTRLVVLICTLVIAAFAMVPTVQAATFKWANDGDARALYDQGYGVRSLYARLYAIDQEQKALEAGRELTDLLTATAKARYSSGGGEQESLLKAQLQVTRLEEQLEDHHAERRAIVAELNRWLDRPGDSPFGPVTALPETAAPSPAGESTRVRMARAAVATAERRLASARLDLKPDLTPSGAFATRKTWATGPNTSSWYMRISVATPLMTVGG